MKEYCIYNIWNGGTPFILRTYTSYFECRVKLQEMIDLEEERNRPYYVDNDFWNNKYPMGIKGKYFTIKVREITSWEKYEENKSEIKNNNCKILKFHK